MLEILAKAPLDKVIPHAQVTPYLYGQRICSGEHLAEAAFLIISGTCELRRTAWSGEPQALHLYSIGGVFGCHEEPMPEDLETEVIATSDCVVLRIACEDLAAMASELEDREPPISLADAGLTKRAVFFDESESGQLVTLAFLSSELPALLIEKSIASVLHKESGANVALVRLLGTNSASQKADIILDGSQLRPVRITERDGGYASLTVGVPPDAKAEVLGELLTHLSRCYEHVLISAHTETLPFRIHYEAIAKSETAYLFVRTGQHEVSKLELLLRELRPRLNSHIPVRLNPVVCAMAGESARGADEFIEKLHANTHIFVRDCPPNHGPLNPSSESHSDKFKKDIRWIAREIGHCLVGLALSSGGVKGLAHVGIINVLEENGIEVDIVAGASMGAYVGALWAYGCNGSELEKLALEMESKWALWRLIDPVFPPRQGFIRGLSVKRRIQRTIDKVHFSELAHPLRVLATNLDTLERVVFSSGEVASAVHASVAVPGLCVPVVIGADAYVDGGIVDPLPTDVLREMGIRHIIAANTIPKVNSIRHRLKASRKLGKLDERRSRKLSREFAPLNDHLNYFAEGNILDIFMHSIHGAQIRVAESACKHASIVLRPELSDTHWLDFRNTSRCLRAGRAVAEKHIEEIKALLRDKEPSNEHPQVSSQLAATA